MAVNVRAFLIEQGLIEPHDIPSTQGEFRIICPDCANEKRKCYVSGSGNGVLCFHCKMRQTWRSFQRRYEPPTPQEIAMDNYVAACYEHLVADEKLMEWFAARGMDADTIRSQRFGYHAPGMMVPSDLHRELGLTWNDTPDSRFMLEGQLTIPYLRDGLIQTVRGRAHPDNQDKPGVQKYMSLKGSQGYPYYPSSIDPDQPVVVVEGEFDAVLLRANGIQAIGVPGAQNARTHWFDGLHQLYISFDGDEPGREGADKLLKSLPEIRRIEMPEHYDASDYLLTFGLESFRVLMERAILYLCGKPQKDDRFATIVTDYENWAWTNGNLLGPCIPWAPRFEAMLSGWAPGLILIGSTANSGKSCFKVKSLLELCKDNPDDTIGVYLSLDDTVQEAMTRLMSLHSGIDFNKIVTPRYNIQNDPTLLATYNAAFETLKQIPNLILRDATYGRSLRYLRSFFSSLRLKYPDKRLVVFIDSLAKITAESGDDEDEANGNMSTKTNWKAYLAAELKYLTTRHNLCIVTATDLRKLNGTRRPTGDDLKDAAELRYEANAVLLMYNDLRTAGKDAVLTWQYQGETESVLEVIVDKNKITGKLGTVRYHMHGGTSNFWECSIDEDAVYSATVRAQAFAKSSREAA